MAFEAVRCEANVRNKKMIQATGIMVIANNNMP